MLAYYTSSQVDTLLGDYRTGTAQDAETTGAITAALLAYYTAAQVDALLGDYRTASAQDTQTQAAITGALLAYRTGPDQDVFTTNQITSALVAYRSAADQGHGDGLKHRRRAAQLLHLRTSGRPPRRQAQSHGGGLCAANSRALSGRRRGRRGGGRHRRADPGPHGRLALKLDGPPQQRLQRGPGHTHRGSERGRLHPEPSGEPVEHRAHLQLDARARAPLRLPLPARHGLQLRGAHVRGRQRLRPVVRQLRGRPGRLEHGQDVLHSAAKRSCEAAHFQTPGLPNQTAGTLDVYGLQILDATLETGNAEEEDTAASALLLKHEFLDGGADDVTLATLGEVLLEPTLTTLGNFLVRSNSQTSVASASFTVGGFQLEGYAMTLSAFAWNRTYTLTPGRRYSFGCRYRLGTASNLVMYVSAADNDYVGVTLSSARPRRECGARRAWTSRCRQAALRSLRRVHPRAGAAVGGHAGPVQHADQGQRLRGRVCLGNGPAGGLAGPHGSATLDGLTAQGNVGCDQLLCNDVNCTTGVDASGAISCAALTATGTVAGAALSSTGAVSGSSLSISGAASVGLLSSATGITGSTLTINNTANAGNFTTVGDVSTGTLTASGAATAASFAATGALTGATLTITGAASAGPLDCESLDCTFTATSGGVSTGSVVCGDVTSSGTVSAPQLFASNTLTVTNTSDFSDDLFLTKNWAGWSKLQVSNNSAAPDSGPELRPGQPEREGLPGAGRRGAPVRAHHDQRRGAGADQEPLHAAVPDHEPAEPWLPRDRGQHGQRGLQHELHGLVRQPGEDGDCRDVAELLQLFDSVEAKQYKRPDMNGDLRLGFASDDCKGFPRQEAQGGRAVAGRHVAQRKKIVIASFGNPKP